MARRQPAPYEDYLEYNKKNLASKTIWAVPGSTFKRWPKRGDIPALGNGNGDDSFKVNVFNVTNKDIEFNVTFQEKYLVPDGPTFDVINVGPGPQVLGGPGTYRMGNKVYNADVIGDPFQKVTFVVKKLLSDGPVACHLCSVSANSKNPVPNYQFRWRSQGDSYWSSQASFPIPDNDPGKSHVQNLVVSKRVGSSQIFAAYADVDESCKYGCDNRCMNQDSDLPSGYFNGVNDD